MPYAAGVYGAPSNSWNPAVAGSAINATDWAALLADLTTALSTCVLKDGTQTMTAALPMGGFKVTGLAAGSANGDSVRWEQIFNAGGIASTLVLRSYLSGLNLSTAGGSATMSIAAGQATDGTNAALMSIGAFSKTTSAWVLGSGNGGLDTGSISTATWYHFWLIQRPDTGVVDVLISLSASAPTMPANYTLKRRIGSGLTDGSSHWTAFTQDGDLFQWNTLVADVSSTNPGTSAVTNTITTPTGVNTTALIQAVISTTNAGSGCLAYFSDLATTDSAPSTTLTDVSVALNAATGSQIVASRLSVRTNTSAQIRSRFSFSDAGLIVKINTLGWIDSRGRNS